MKKNPSSSLIINGKVCKPKLKKNFLGILLKIKRLNLKNI